MTGLFAALILGIALIFIACIMIAGTAILSAPFLFIVAWIIRQTKPG